VIAVEVGDSCQFPLPAMTMAVRGEPPICSTVPPAPDPLPRRTTPEVEMVIAPSTRKVPAARRTAPRMPPEAGSLDTASMAAWMAGVSSLPPDGCTVCRTGTPGMATPPPM
jgi:hypothetical protein